MFKLILLVSLLVLSGLSSEAKAQCDISCIWNHSTKPATLFVDSGKGEISVHSHDNNGKAIGLVVLKGVQPTSESSLWNAQMYSADDDAFVDVQIASEGCNQLSVDYQGEEILLLVR